MAATRSVMRRLSLARAAGRSAGRRAAAQAAPAQRQHGVGLGDREVLLVGGGLRDGHGGPLLGRGSAHEADAGVGPGAGAAAGLAAGGGSGGLTQTGSVTFFDSRIAVGFR